MPDIGPIQEEVLTTLYELHEENPFVSFNTEHLVEEVIDALGADQSEIEYQLNILDERFFLNFPPALNSRGSISLRPRGVDELQRGSGGTFLETEDQFYILSELEDLDRESPGAYWDGEDFRNGLEIENDVIDFIMWYLIEKGWVDASRVSGDPTYTALKIDTLGRQALERYRAQPVDSAGEDGNETLSERRRRTETSIDLPQMLGQEEGVSLEFKETFLYDVYRNQANTDLKEEVVKEICAFANTEGGVLIIGVEDETHEVEGLDRDLSLMQEGKDSFERQLNQEISSRIGSSFASIFTRVAFEEVDQEEVCIVRVDRAPDPVYCDNTLYLRNGSSSIPLDTQEAVNYVEQHWP